MRRWDQLSRDKSLKAYQLQFPADLDVERVVAWLHTTSGSLRPRMPALMGTPTMVFELWSTEHGFSYRFMIPWQHADYVVSQLRSLVPGTHVTPDESYPRRRWTKAVEIGLQVPSRQLHLGQPADTSASLLASINTLETGEAVVMQWVVTPSERQHLPVQKETRSDHMALRSMLLGRVEANADEVNDRRDKLLEPNMQAVLRIAAHANTSERAKHLIFNVKRSMSARASAGTGFTRRMATTTTLQKRIDNAATPMVFPMQLSLTELASLIAWPLGSPQVVGLPPAVARHIPVPDTVPREGGRPFGKSNYPGRERTVSVSFEDLLTHVWWVGSTGSGKTTALANGLKADVEAGHGIFLLESKGDLFKQALEYIPPEREKDVIVLDLSMAHRAVGLNLLDQGNADRTIDAMTRFFDDMYGGTRGVWSRAVFYNGLKVLAANPGCGLLDLIPLLDPQTPEHRGWRNEAIQRCSDEEVRNWFALHDAKPDAKRQQIITPVTDRVWEFGKPKLKTVLGQSHSSFKFADVVKNNKILLVNLAGVEPHAAEVLGALIFDQYWAAVQVDGNRPPKPNYGYYDEFQRFCRMQADFADVLATSRSKLWGHTMANQYRDQLPDHLLDALTRNAATQVVFRADGKESAAFANEFGALVQRQDFECLPPRTAIAKFASNGSSTPAFTLTTNPPATPYGNGTRIRGDSLAMYGKDAADVEAEIEARRRAGGNRPSGQKYSWSDRW